MLYWSLETHNTSIAIASTITAYARIYISQFKNNLNFNLYYSDTNSVYVDRLLPDEKISDKKFLGQMKLESVLTDAIFLAPKLYCLLTEDGKLIHKVKGFSHEIKLSLNDFKNLLFKQSFLEKVQIKWIKIFWRCQLLK